MSIVATIFTVEYGDIIDFIGTGCYTNAIETTPQADWKRGHRKMTDTEWLTQAQIAEQLNVPIDRVRQAVSVLAPAGIIKTSSNPLDKRYLLVESKAVPIIRSSIFGK